jgi:hypothetical protein
MTAFSFYRLPKRVDYPFPYRGKDIKPPDNIENIRKSKLLTTVFFYITYSPIFIEETNGTIRFESEP